MNEMNFFSLDIDEMLQSAASDPLKKLKEKPGTTYNPIPETATGKPIKIKTGTTYNPIPKNLK